MYSPEIIGHKWAEAEHSIQRKLKDPNFRLHEYSREESIALSKGLLKSYDSEGKQIRQFSEAETLFVLNELTLSKISFKYWVERYCMVNSESQKLVPLVLRATQLKLLQKWGELENTTRPLQKGKVAVILVKPRQIGATVMSQAAIAHATMLQRRARALTASDVPEKSLNLYQIQERIYDNLPPWMRPSMSGRVKADHLHYDALDSDLMVGTGNQKSAMGQGVTLDHVHLSEVSTWEPTYVGQIDDDIGPAFLQSAAPTSLFMLESTAKGMDRNWFYEQYQNAKKELGWFRAIFISWFDDPTKSLPAEGVTFTDSTLNVAARVKVHFGVDLSRDQLAWYQVSREQFEAKERLEDFLQEYPSTDDEAFQTGWRSVFPISVRDRIRQEMKPLAGVIYVDVKKRKFITENTQQFLDSKVTGKEDGRLLVWEAAKPGFTYVVGVDTSYGIGRDSSAIVVNRVGNKHLPDEQVAEWWGTIDPIDLAIVVEMVGKFYTDRIEGRPAMLAIESNPGSPGLITQTELVRKGYPNWYMWKKLNVVGGGFTNTIGWYTTPSTRPLLTKTGVKYISEGTWKVNSPFFLQEMKTFVDLGLKMGKQHLEHAPGFHDDRIMAGFIALYVSHEDDQINMAEERRAFLDNKLHPKPAKQYQHTGMTWEEICRHWETGEPPEFPEDFA